MSANGDCSLALWQRFSALATDHARRSAVSASGRRLTFEALRDAADEIASGLSAAGVRDGAFLGLAVGNSPAFMPALLGLGRCAARIGLLSPKYGEQELRAVLAGAPMELALLSPDAAERWRAAGLIENAVSVEAPHTGERLTLVRVRDRLAAAENGESHEALRGAALVKFTSGSTGAPKGVALGIDNLLAEADNICASLGLDAGDCILSPAPLCHSYGFDLAALPLITRGCEVRLHELLVPRRVLAEMSEPGVSVFLGTPGMYRFLLEAAGGAPARLSPRWLISCTAPLSEATLMAFQQRFGAWICQHYGASETGGLTLHEPEVVAQKPASVGRPLSGVSLSVDSDGQVVARGPAISRGYVLGAPQGVAPFRDGAYFTGDLGRIDADGFLFIDGRLDQLINVGGLKVSPQEVVDALERHPGVREAAVLGVRRGDDEVVVGVVVLRGPASEAELIGHCRARLADYKTPRRIVFREAIPKGPGGKPRLRAEELAP